jgi:hypothetical protein
VSDYSGQVHDVVPVPTAWLLRLVNGYTPEVREAAGAADQAYPSLDPTGFPLPRRSQDLVELAEAHWQVFVEVDPERRSRLLTVLLRRAELSPAITPSGELAWSTSHRHAVGRAAAACAVALLEVVQRRGWDRIGVCGGDDCLDAFIDEAGSSHRVYCSTTCLNRAKVRAHRARRNRTE